MRQQLRHDADLVSRERSLRRRSHNPGLTIALVLLIGFAVPAMGQASGAGSALLIASLPDAPQSQVSFSQEQAPPQPAPAPQEQTALAGIHGVVVNRDGAVYEGVHVTLTHTPPAIGPERTTTSDSNGRFYFPDVPAGAFQISVSSSGFVTQTVTGVLKEGESYEGSPIVLSFASTNSEVQVTASRLEVAEEQLHEEEQQRVLGVIPNFYVVYAPDAAPLTSRQKFHLAWKSLIDPVSIGIDLVTAGVQQSSDDYRDFGQGAQGYAKRFGALYATDATGTMLGAAILPSLLHQDPRYFYKGTGTWRSRALYAIAASVICKSDKGRWQPNYSTIGGGLAAGGIANFYYPEKDRDGIELSFQNVLIGIGGAAVENLFQEFVVRKLTPRLPNYGSPKP